MAVFSVSEMVGMIGPRIFMTMLEMSARRIGVIRKTAITTAYAASSQSGAPKPVRITAPRIAQTMSGAPRKPMASIASTAPMT
jgi:hypothetical protein